jgi:flagellar protein FlaG
MTIDTIGALGSARPAERSFAGSDTAGARSTAPATAVATANAVKGTPSLDQLNRAVSELNQSQQAKSQGLEFSIDSDTKRTVVKVIDQSTKEVLRQIPTPEALEIAKALEAKSTRGVLIQQTA